MNLSPQRRAQLDEIDRLERAYDAMPDDVRERCRQLAAGTIDALPPLKSASEWIAERAKLQARAEERESEICQPPAASASSGTAKARWSITARATTRITTVS